MASSLLEGLVDEIIAAISPPSQSRSDEPVEATNLKTMGSYNWIDNETPTIAIPGYPTRWKGARLPIHMSRDPIQSSFNEDHARKCGYPLEPDIRAIQVTQESLGVNDFDLSEERVDVVTNRNNLRKLLHFATSANATRRSSSLSHFNKFRIDVQLAPNGRTMILTRFEPPVRNTRTELQPLSFDELFERATTEQHPSFGAVDAAGNQETLQRVGYHRIVRYDLLGMRFLVHARVDSMVKAEDPDVESLTNALRDTSLDNRSSSETLPPPPSIVQVDGSNLQHVRFGDCVPQEQLMDIKTAVDGRVKWDDTYPQFFLSQTPNLLIATRRRLPQNEATITQFRTHTRETLRTQHNQQSSRIAQLVVVLGQMRSIMQDFGRGSPLAFVWDSAGDTRIYRIERLGEYMSDEGLSQF